MIGDLDRRLRADGVQWRTGGHTVPPLGEAVAAVTGGARDAAAWAGGDDSPDAAAELLVLDPPSASGESATTSGRRIRGWAVAAAVACVALVAVGVAALTHDDSGHRASPTGGAEAGIVGYRWKLTQVIDGYGTLTVAGWPVMLAFTPDGYMSSNDRCNGISGRYRLRDRGYDVHNVNSTLVGCRFPAGSADARIMNAIDAAFNLVPPGSAGHEAPDVAARLDGSTLYLTPSGSGITIVAARDGKEPNAINSTVPTTPVPGTATMQPTH